MRSFQLVLAYVQRTGRRQPSYQDAKSEQNMVYAVSEKVRYTFLARAQRR